MPNHLTLPVSTYLFKVSCSQWGFLNAVHVKSRGVWVLTTTTSRHLVSAVTPVKAIVIVLRSS
jgi:hypothetical protein